MRITGLDTKTLPWNVTENQVLEALEYLQKRFSKRKWFKWIGTGRDDKGNFVLMVGRKDSPPPSRVNQLCEYNGLPVIIGGPW